MALIEETKNQFDQASRTISKSVKFGEKLECDQSVHLRSDPIVVNSSSPLLQERVANAQVAPNLNPLLLDMPPMAIDAARRELLRLGERVGNLLDAPERA